MLVYRDLTTDPARLPPDLRGCPTVSMRRTEHGRLVACATQFQDPGLELGDPTTMDPDAAWVDLPEQWQVAATAGVDPMRLVKRQRWCRTLPISDSRGRQWLVPAVLTPGGLRAFAAPMGGDDFTTPILSPEQQELLRVATAARDELERQVEEMRQRRLQGESLGEAALVAITLPFPRLAQWLARLVATTHWLAPLTCARLGLIDDRMVGPGLFRACGLLPADSDVEVVAPHG